jgi:hypothetical protein
LLKPLFQTVNFPFSVRETPKLMLKSQLLAQRLQFRTVTFPCLMINPQKLLCFIEKSLLRGNTGLMDSIKEYLSPSTTLFRRSTTTTGAGREGFDQLEDLD